MRDALGSTAAARHSDSDDRHQTVTSYDRNLVIVAGAGTGKTSLLVERILNQVVEQDLALSEIAAITFTDKAATEMRNRLEAGLARLANLARERATAETLNAAKEADRAYAHLAQRLDAEAIEARAAGALRELPRATISTIHSFCASVLRAHPVESAVNSRFTVDEGITLAALLEELWEEFLEGEHGPEGSQREQWLELLEVFDLRELRSLAFQLGDFSVPLPPSKPFLPEATVVLAPRVTTLRERIDALLEEGTEPKAGPESYLDATRSLLEILLREGLPRFREALTSTPYRSSRGPKALLDGRPPTAKALPEATQCAADARKLLEALLLIDDSLVTRSIDLVVPFAEQAREEARRRGILSFDALLSLTRDLLARHRDVRRRLARQFQVLLVDEFQDTDPLQYEILFFLAEALGAPQADDAFATRLEPGKLFIVGDPKQSIYRFRRADISAYHRAVAHVEACGGRRRSLTTSWRALPDLLDPLNPLFESLLTPKTESDRDVEPGYERMESGRRPAEDGARVELWTIAGAGGPQPAEQARSAEGEVIADWIARQCQAGRLSFGEVAILLRALSHVHLYTHALRQRGIPFALESRQNPLDHPVGLELYALLRSIANPNDAPAVLGVLRSALGATPDAELLRFARSRAAAWCYLEVTPDPQCFPNVARSYEFLRRWYERSLLQPPAELLARLLDETPFPALHAAAEDGPHRVRILRALIDRLAEIARGDPEHTVRSLLPWLESETALPSSGVEDDKVRILTVHGAKGLEFPTVILPDLGRGPGGDDPRRRQGTRVAWLPGRRALAISTDAARSASWVHHTWEEQRHAWAEHKRLFYVACTRAEERLILVHAPRRRSHLQAWVGFLSPWGYPDSGLSEDGALVQAPAVVHRVVEAEMVTRMAEVSRGQKDWLGAVRRTQAIVEAATERAVPPVQSPSGLREEDAAAREAADGEEGHALSVSADLARLVGLAVHEALERWDFRDRGVLAAQLEAAVTRVSRDAALDPEAVQTGARVVIDGLLTSELPGYLASSQILGRELPLLFEDGDGRAWSGTLDLLYRDPDGRLVVADYKTDREPGPETTERYRGQLEIYARGVALAFPEAPPPAKELLYVRTGQRVRLE
jgi:ATP-dependent helicase/nuclease subunit A